MPELRHLRAFTAVAEESSFTRAAEHLHLAQQAVSKSVQQLERELGVQLLERTTREVRLTAAGASLLDAGRRVLTAADDAFARAQTVGRGLAGTVYVGVSPSIALPERHEVARVLRDGAPDLSVSFHEIRPSEAAAALHDRSLDLTLMRTFAGAPGIEQAELRGTPVELVAPPGHPLATDAPISLAELDGVRVMTWSAPGTPFTDLLLGRIAQAGATAIPVESKVTGGGGAPELAAADAVAIVPVDTYSGADVVRVPILGGVTVPLLLLWASGLPHAAVMRLRAGLPAPGDRRRAPAE